MVGKSMPIFFLLARNKLLGLAYTLKIIWHGDESDDRKMEEIWFDDMRAGSIRFPIKVMSY